MGTATAPARKLFGGSSARTLPILLLIIVVLFGASFWAWHRWGGEVIRQEKFRLEASNISIPAQPDWIQTDIREEVLRESLHEASLLDRELTVRIARAFAAHPWVARVRRVSKQPPANLIVELDYRVPVAMVEMQDARQQNVVYAIDADGVVLPSDFFLKQPDEVGRYPLIAADNLSLSVPVGTQWGDYRIAAAAKIAAELLNGWERYGLYRISASIPPSRNQTSAPIFVLSTKSGAQITWGHAPGKESNGEPPALEKRRRLENYVDRRGSLADLSSTTVIDLSDSASLEKR